MDKDRFEALMKLAKFARAVRDDRRKTEWKLSFSVWALLVAASQALKGQPLCPMLVAGISIAVAHGWWVVWNSNRASHDAYAMYGFVSRAETELDASRKLHFEDKGTKPSLSEAFFHTPVIVQWAITVGLIVGVIVVTR